MNILDENISESQRQFLHRWRIKVRQIGSEFSQKGIKDENIIPFLHRLKFPTFFTRDLGFYHHNLCHRNYCLVCLDVGQYEVASFIWRFLRHPSFNTQAKRKGKVFRITHTGIHLWEFKKTKEEKIFWVPSR